MRKGVSVMFRPRKTRPSGQQKAERQSSLFDSLSRRRARSRVGEGRGAGEPSRPVVIDVESSDEEQEGDPYVFLNTQSNEVEPERPSATEIECKTPRTSAKPCQTPTVTSRKLTPRGKNSPATEMERLSRQEKEELQLALKESKKEMEREERRRRHERREAIAGKTEAEEQQQLLAEFHQRLKKVDDTMESVMAAETLTLESTSKEADQDSSNQAEVAPTKSAVKSMNSNSEDEWSQATPPLTSKPTGASSPRNLKSVFVEKLRAHSIASHAKKDTYSEHEENLQSGHEEMSVEEGLVGETDGASTHSVSVAQSSSEDDKPKPRDKGRVCSQSGDETPPLLFQNEPHIQIHEHDAQPRDAPTKEVEGGHGDHKEVIHLEEADIPPISASGHLIAQQKESKDQHYRGGEVVGEGGGGGHPPAAETGYLPDHSTAVEILSSKTREAPSRARMSLKRSRKRDTKSIEYKEVEQHKVRLGDDLEEAMDTSAPRIGKEELDLEVSPDVKKSRLDQTEPVVGVSSDTQLAHSSHTNHSVVEKLVHCPTNSEQDGQTTPDVHEEQGDLRKQNGNISASKLSMEQLDSSAPKGKRLQKLPVKPSKGAEPHSSPNQQAKKVLRGRRGDTKTATRPTKQLPSVSVRPNPPPLLFAHSGKPPAEYTPTIVQSFDDYFTQLWHAQRQVLHRLAWGDPVPVHSKQPSSTLDLQRKRKRMPGNLEPTPRKWPDGGITRSPNSGWLLQKSTHQKPSVSDESPVDVRSDVRNTGPFVHTRIENTPGRRNLSLKRRPLSCRESEKGEPSKSKLPVKGDASVAEQTIEVSHQDVPEAATAEYNLNEMLASPNDELLQPTCSPKLPPEDTQSDDVVLITQSDTHSDKSHQSPIHNSQLSSSSKTGDIECSQNQQYEIQEREQPTPTPSSTVGMSTTSAAPSNEEWITWKSRKPDHPSQTSTKELMRPTLHSSSRKRKRARFMDESETESEDDSDRDGHRAKRHSKDREFQPAHLQRKSITPSNADDSSTEIESGPETLTVLQSSTSRHPQLPSLLFSGGSTTRGRRRKREEATLTRKTPDKTAHLHCQADSIIDLTEDTQTMMPTSGDISPAENLSEKEALDGGTVVCPICQKGFRQAVIERHAAECDDIGSGDEASTNQRNSPLRIRSTTRDQLALPRGDAEMPSVSSGERSEQEEGSGGETGGSEAEDFSRDPSPTYTGEYEANITTDRSSSAGPQLYQSEDGGYVVDPTTVSHSPIRTFTRIRDLAPQERVGYYNQFSYGKSRRPAGAGRLYGEASRSNTWGRSDFDELLYDHRRSTRGPSRGRGRGRGRGWRGERGGRQHQRGNYHHYRKRGSNSKRQRKRK